MPDEQCRLAKLEESHDNQKEIFERHMKEEEDRWLEVSTKLQEIHDRQIKMVGFWAGTTFTFSILGSLVVWFFQKAFIPGN